MHNQNQEKRIPVLVRRQKVAPDGRSVHMYNDTVYMTQTEVEAYRKQERERPFEAVPLVPIISY